MAALDDGRLASASGDPIRARPLLHPTAYKFAACGSAFEFEELAQSCRKQNCLGDLFCAAAVQQHSEKIGGLSASARSITQASIFDAILPKLSASYDVPEQKR